MSWESRKISEYEKEIAAKLEGRQGIKNNHSITTRFNLPSPRSLLRTFVSAFTDSIKEDYLTLTKAGRENQERKIKMQQDYEAFMEQFGNK